MFITMSLQNNGVQYDSINLHAAKHYIPTKRTDWFTKLNVLNTSLSLFHGLLVFLPGQRFDTAGKTLRCV